MIGVKNKESSQFIKKSILVRENLNRIHLIFTERMRKKMNQIKTDKKSVIVLGSGPIRIGQGVEFDYATVHSVWAIQEAGYEAIIVNNNPETVSTDFSISDKLYFEPLTIEDVMHIVDLEQPEGVIVQFGGQTAINLAEGLEARGVKILGTSLEDIDRAENRNKFERALREIGIPQPLGKTAVSVPEAVAIANEIGYPVLVTTVLCTRRTCNGNCLSRRRIASLYGACG